MFICRLCLQNNLEKCEIVSIWDNNCKLLSRIKNCVSIEIKEDNKLPGFVCLPCVRKIIDWENFKRNCHKNAILLEKLLQDKNVLNKSPENEEKLSISKQVLDNNPFLENEEKLSSSKQILDNNPFLEGEGKLSISKNVLDNSPFRENEEKLSISEKVLDNIPFLENEEKLSISEDVKNEYIFEENDLEQPILLSTEELYMCEICFRQFDNCFDYLDHQETHNGQPVFKCDLCSEVFSLRKDLVFHDQNHKARCPYCSKYVAKPSMKSHLILHSDRFMCNLCGGKFNSHSSLDTHTLKVHTNIKNYVCDNCGKRFSCKTSLKIHLRTHSEKRLYKCIECDYTGRTASAVYAHKSTHSQDLRVCQHCPKTFKSIRNLNDHLRRVHSREKKHRCIKCNKAFVDKHMLSVHQRWHTGDRPYKCNKCDKAFIRSDGLHNHMDTHEFHAKYDCKKCGKKFKSKRSIIRHTCTANSVSNQ